jgi:Mlc titration factor MtfA (ptsG expression regulator)
VFHRRKGLSESWPEIATTQLQMWSWFSDDERARLGVIADWLLRHKHWESAHGFELNDEIVTTIALSAAVLVLELGTEYYREVSAIIVYPTTVLSRGVYAGPVRGTVTDDAVPVLGQAHDHRGPIIIAWDDALHGMQNPGLGRNVVFHEFAHKLDMLDDVTDGTPPLESKEQLARWVEVCTEAYGAVRAGEHRPPLDPYAGTNPAEFFAVATEAFFDVPVQLREHEPKLYAVLRAFYDQDPALRTG